MTDRWTGITAQSLRKQGAGFAMSFPPWDSGRRHRIYLYGLLFAGGRTHRQACSHKRSSCSRHSKAYTLAFAFPALRRCGQPASRHPVKKMALFGSGIDFFSPNDPQTSFMCRPSRDAMSADSEEVRWA